MSWVMHRKGNTAFLPCLFLNCLVLKTPSGLGGEQGIRLMSPPKWANSWDGKYLFVMKILVCHFNQNINLRKILGISISK